MGSKQSLEHTVDRTYPLLIYPYLVVNGHSYLKFRQLFVSTGFQMFADMCMCVCAKLGQLNKRHLFSTSTMPWSKSSGRLGESVLWYYQARYKSQSYSIQYLLSQYYNICINPNGMYKSQYIPYAIYRYLYPC